MAVSYRDIVKAGVWEQNAVLGQMLSLCPTMAVTSGATNGLGMGLATMTVLALTNLLVAGLRSFITPEVRIPAFVLIIATVVTLVEMSLNAWLHELYKVLGLFVPLIVVNCLILGRAESFASKQPVLPSIVDGLAMGAGFSLALTLIGAIREILGSGTLFANASVMLGPAFSFLEMKVIPDYQGMLVMILPPGGFLTVGFLLAGKRALEARAGKRRAAAALDGPACHAVD
ncbi:MAG: RnfABCDGE type electron transport complex subunit E [Azospirillum sp.]|nr:RnfABCDGE type electron transport complex subunit E [Azospirillum sp.]